MKTQIYIPKVTVSTTSASLRSAPADIADDVARALAASLTGKTDQSAAAGRRTELTLSGSIAHAVMKKVQL